MIPTNISGGSSNIYDDIIIQLSKIKQLHEDDLAHMQARADVSEKFSMLITALIQYVPQQIMVVDKESNAILIMNEIAIMEMHKDINYVENIIELMSTHEIFNGGAEVEITYESQGAKRYFHVRAFELEWDGRNALIYVISDISEAKKELEELEEHAYHDGLTGLYNRAYGMKTLHDWVESKRQFVLLFADLDSLKYINDAFGHNEGDAYILNAAKHLQALSKDAVVCRLGGDEFMAIMPDVGHDEIEKSAAETYNNLATDEYQADKEYSYSMSYGFVTIGAGNTLGVSEILSIADERMYENKRARKKERRT